MLIQAMLFLIFKKAFHVHVVHTGTREKTNVFEARCATVSRYPDTRLPLSVCVHAQQG